jgi:hypothetical protein
VYGFENDSHEFRVYSYNGTTWDDFGALSPTPPLRSSYSMALDKSGHTLVAYFNESDSLLRIYQAYGSGSWGQVYPYGQVVISSGIYPDKIDLVMDTASGVPYCLFRSGYASQPLHVLTFQNSTWKKLSTAGLPEANWNNSSIAVSPNGSLYAFLNEYLDPVTKISAYIFNGASWTKYGSNFVSDDAENQRIPVTFTATGEPVVAVKEGSNAKVKVFANGKWSLMADCGSIVSEGELSITLGPNNVVYVGKGGNYSVVKTGFDL